MPSLHLVDTSIILSYFLLVGVVGLWLTRRASGSIEHYFLGGRKLPWYLLGIAGMGSWFDLTGTMIITSFLFMLGPRGLYVEFRGGACLTLAFLLAYVGKWHRRSGVMTGAEWMTYRFGTGPSAEAARLLSALMGIVSTVGLVGLAVRGVSLFLGLMFPYPPMLSTAVLIGLATLYTMLAGFYGVVLTDLLQGTIVMVSCVIVGFLAWSMVPSSDALATTAQAVTGNTQWTQSMISWETTLPKGYEMYQMLIIVAAFYLFRQVLGSMGAGTESRYFGARDERSCGMQSLLQGVTVMFRWPMMIGLAVMGIYLVQKLYPDTAVVAQAADLIRSYYPTIEPGFWHDLTNRIVNSPNENPALAAGLQKILGSDWVTKLPMIGYNGTVNPEKILPAVLMTQIPVGLKGLLIVAMFAATSSAMTGAVNGAGALFVRDIYQNFLRKKAHNRELILVSYLATLSLVAAGFYMGVVAKSSNDLWGWIVMGLCAGGLAPAFLRLYWWRCNGWGIAVGSLVGGVGAIVQRCLWPGMIEWQQFLMMTSLSFAGTIAGSLLTAPTPIDRLRFFYRTTRPFGLWKPLREEMPSGLRASMEKEHRNDIITIPFALLWQVTLFLLPMQLIIKAYDSVLWTLPLFLVGCAGMYYFWYRNLPAAGAKTPLEQEQEAQAQADSAGQKAAAMPISQGS